MKYSQLISELISAGCYKKRDANGSHEVWYSPITKRLFIVPVHGSKEVPKGTELNIRKASGVYKGK